MDNCEAKYQMLKRKFNQKEEENLCLREQVREYECNRCNNSGFSQATITRLELDRDAARGDCIRLCEENKALREDIQRLRETQRCDQKRLEDAKKDFENCVAQFEVERAGICAENKQLSEDLRHVREKTRELQAEVTEQRTRSNHLKLASEQAERVLRTTQDLLHQTEAELTSALDRIQELNEETKRLQWEVKENKQEKTSLKSNMSRLDQEKDTLLLKVDEKTEQNARLESELESRDRRIASLEAFIADLQKKLDVALDTAARSEQSSRQNSLDTDRLRKELDKMERCRDNAVKENSRLQDDLAALTHEYQTTKRSLECSKREVEDLKLQLQHYVTEARRINQILEEKEQERMAMLEQFRSLTMESANLETNNHSLESEAKSTKSVLRETQARLQQLETSLQQKQGLISGYEKQIKELTQEVAKLERKLESRARAECASRDLSRELETQKHSLSQKIDQLSADKKQVRDLNCQIQKLGMELESRTRAESVMSREHETHRQSLIQKIVDLENEVESQSRYEQASTNLSRKLESENQCLASKVCELEKQLECLTKSEQAARNLSKDMETQNGSVLRKMVKLEKKLEERSKKERELKDLVQNLENQRDCLSKKMCELQKKLECQSLSENLLSKEFDTKKNSLMEKIYCLEKELDQRSRTESVLTKELETQRHSMAKKIVELEKQLESLTKSEHTSKELVKDLECQRDCQMQKITRLEKKLEDFSKTGNVLNKESQLQEEVIELREELSHMQEQLGKERRNSATLENVLASSRQETLQRNKDCSELKAQVNSLQNKLKDLQDKLEHGTEALQRCQTECKDYQVQVSELKREVTNEKFERARMNETRRSRPVKRSKQCNVLCPRSRSLTSLHSEIMSTAYVCPCCFLNRISSLRTTPEASREVLKHDCYSRPFQLKAKKNFCPENLFNLDSSSSAVKINSNTLPEESEDFMYPERLISEGKKSKSSNSDHSFFCNKQINSSSNSSSFQKETERLAEKIDSVLEEHKEFLRELNLTVYEEDGFRVEDLEFSGGQFGNKGDSMKFDVRTLKNTCRDNKHKVTENVLKHENLIVSKPVFFASGDRKNVSKTFEKGSAGVLRRPLEKKVRSKKPKVIFAEDPVKLPKVVLQKNSSESLQGDLNTKSDTSKHVTVKMLFFPENELTASHSSLESQEDTSPLAATSSVYMTASNSNEEVTMHDSDKVIYAVTDSSCDSKDQIDSD